LLKKTSTADDNTSGPALEQAEEKRLKEKSKSKKVRGRQSPLKDAGRYGMEGRKGLKKNVLARPIGRNEKKVSIISLCKIPRASSCRTGRLINKY